MKLFNILVYRKVSYQQLLSRYYGMSLIFLSLLVASLYPIFILLINSKISLTMVSFLYALFGFLFSFPKVIQNKKLHQFKSKGIIKQALIITIISNVIYLQLYLLALQYSDPIRVSVLALSQTFFAYFIYVWILKQEKFTLAKLLGSVLMVFGAIMFIGGFSSLTSLSLGDGLILIGSAIIPFAYQFQKDLSNYAANEVIISLRGGISAIIFGLWVLIMETTQFVYFFDIYSVVIIAVCSLLTYVIGNIAWLEGLKFVVTSRAVSLIPLQNVFTVILSIIFLGISISFLQIIGVIPLVLGTVILLNPLIFAPLFKRIKNLVFKKESELFLSEK